MKKQPNEIWRDIKGFEGFYQVSNLGRVKSIACRRLSGRDKGGDFAIAQTEHIMTPVVSESGYLKIVLRNNSRAFKTSVHRLVATAFISNPKNLQFVNHINENKKDNIAENLEWCTHSYNCNYGTRSNRQSKAMKNHASLSIPVIKLTKEGVEIERYPSISEASRKNGINVSNIANCCKGKAGSNSAGGFKWEKVSW